MDATEFNEIILNSTTNSWSKQACVKDFDYEPILFKKAENMFECMEIAEYIYKGELWPSYKKPTQAYADCDSHSRNKIGETASSNTHSTTGESTGKRWKWYVDCSKIESKTCIIHVPRHSYDECSFLGDFGANCVKSKPTKDHGNHTIQRKKIIRI